MNITTKSTKIVLIGDTMVGKTMISNALLDAPFQEEYKPTVGAAIVYIRNKNDLTGEISCINLWDTAGQEKYHSLTPIYYKEAQSAVIVYDVSNELSFQHVHYWYDLFLENTEFKENKILIVGNKTDLRKDNQEDTSTFVSTEKGLECARSINADFLETSAKTGENISALANKLIEYAKFTYTSTTQRNIETKENNSCCC